MSPHREDYRLLMQNRYWIKQIPWLWASVSELEKARSVHCVDVWRANYKTVPLFKYLWILLYIYIFLYINKNCFSNVGLPPSDKPFCFNLSLLWCYEGMSRKCSHNYSLLI